MLSSPIPPDRPRSLPRLLFIADGFTRREVAESVFEAADAGVPWILLRDRGASAADTERATHRILQELGRLPSSPLLSITAHAPLAARFGLGLHLGSRDDDPASALRHFDAHAPRPLIGYSIHSEKEARGVDGIVSYVFLSPVYPTTHRPETPPIGLQAISSCAAFLAPRPVYALGGITPHRVAECLDAGAHGVAVRSGILEATHVHRAVQAYLAELP